MFFDQTEPDKVPLEKRSGCRESFFVPAFLGHDVLSSFACLFGACLIDFFDALGGIGKNNHHILLDFHKPAADGKRMSNTVFGIL